MRKLLPIGLIAAVLTAGCTGGAPAGHPDSHRTRTHMRIVHPGGGVSVVIEHGWFDASTQTERTVYEVVRSSDPSLDGGDGHETISTLDGYYVKMPQTLHSARRPGATWTQVIWPESYRATAKRAAALGQSFGFDELRAMASKVTQVGRARVRGAPTRHFRLVIPREQLLPFVAALLPEMMASVPDVVNVFPPSFKLQVWIDDQDRAARSRYVMNKDGARILITETQFDWGAPISIQLPAEEQVADRGSFEGSPSP